MHKPTPSQARARLLIVLPGYLLASLVAIAVFKFFVGRALRGSRRQLAGPAAPDRHSKAEVAQAQKKVRKASANFKVAKQHYTRAAAKLTKAQASLAAVTGKPQPAPAKVADALIGNLTAEEWWQSPRGRFVLGTGQMLWRYLLKQREKRQAKAQAEEKAE
jgi:hypothetical protein